MRNRRLATLCMLVLSFAVYSFGENRGQSLTILLYMSYDNNLDSFALSELNELEKCPEIESLRIVVQVDTLTRPIFGSCSTKRLLIRHGIGREIESSLIEDLGEADMGSEDTLSSFISWGIRKFPADAFVLILSGHGGQYKGYGPDETNGSSPFSVNSLGSAIEKGLASDNRLSLLVFDACLMAGIEPLHSLAATTSYIYALETISIGYYTEALVQYLSTFKEKWDVDPKEFGRQVADRHIKLCEKNQHTAIGTLINAKCLVALSESVRELARILSYYESQSFGCYLNVAKAYSDSYKLLYLNVSPSANMPVFEGEIIDISHFLSRAKLYISDKEVLTSLNATNKLLIESIVCSFSTSSLSTFRASGFGGLSIYFPSPRAWRNTMNGNVHSYYSNIGFNNLTQWLRYLKGHCLYLNCAPQIALAGNDTLRIKYNSELSSMFSVNIKTNESHSFDDISSALIAICLRDRNEKFALLGYRKSKAKAGKNDFTIRPKWPSITNGKQSTFIPLIPLMDGFNYLSPVYLYYGKYVRYGYLYIERKGNVLMPKEIVNTEMHAFHIDEPYILEFRLNVYDPEKDAIEPYVFTDKVLVNEGVKKLKINELPLPVSESYIGIAACDIVGMVSDFKMLRYEIYEPRDSKK